MVSSLGAMITWATVPETTLAVNVCGDCDSPAAVACTARGGVSTLGVTVMVVNPLSSLMVLVADSVGFPEVPAQVTVKPLNPPPSASSTRTRKGCGNGLPTTPVCASPLTFASTAAGGTT